MHKRPADGMLMGSSTCSPDGEGPVSPKYSDRLSPAINLSEASRQEVRLGGFFIWTHTYYLVRTSAIKFREIQAAKDFDSKIPNKDFDANEETSLLKGEKQEQVLLLSDSTIQVYTESQVIAPQLSGKIDKHSSFWGKIATVAHQIVEELFAPPTIGSILGFIFGATPWLRGLVIGNDAPLHVIQDTVKLLGDGTIPCITLILGGNLTEGLRSSRLKPVVILGIICVRYMILPIIGIGLVKVAGDLGFLPSDPLFKFVLMVQFTVPPAMNIGTMTQFLDVGQEECSVILLWTYLISALALTVWSPVYMYILS